MESPEEYLSAIGKLVCKLKVSEDCRAALMALARYATAEGKSLTLYDLMRAADLSPLDLVKNS